MQKTDQKITAREKDLTDERVASRLACFVKAVKTNLFSSMEKKSLKPATIRQAEKAEEKFKSLGNYQLRMQRFENKDKNILLDYIMHHRVSLAAEIVKSTANGGCLSRQREKVLRNSIDYIEQRL